MKRSIASTLILLSFGLHAVDSKLELRHREAKGVGYDKGYSTVDYLFLHQWEKPELLFNLRGHVFDDGRFAGNVGIGYRHGFKNDAYMWGVNAFYDCRQSKHLFTNQGGAGLEFLSKYVDVRMNGYLPFGETKAFDKRTFETFSGSHVIVKQKAIGALPCAELEVGVPVTRSFYIAGGWYYLFSQDVKGIHLGNSLGGKFRFEVDIYRYFTLGGLVTHDKIFNATVQGYLSFKIPLSGKWEKKPSVRNLRSVPIYRNEIIPLEEKKRHTALFIGEEGDDPIDFVFVDNMAAAGGDGSIEAPFSSLKEAEAASEPGDIIYVFPGDGTPRNMEEGIVLQEDQIIASAGAPLEIEDVVIPPMTPEESPVITNIHPDQPIVANPGDSNLEDFRIIEPWEYFFGDWDFYNGAGAGVAAGAGAAGGAAIGAGGGHAPPAPPGPGLGAPPPGGGDDDGSVSGGDDDFSDVENDDFSDAGVVIVPPVDNANVGDVDGGDAGAVIVAPAAPEDGNVAGGDGDSEGGYELVDFDGDGDDMSGSGELVGTSPVGDPDGDNPEAGDGPTSPFDFEVVDTPPIEGYDFGDGDGVDFNGGWGTADAIELFFGDSAWDDE